MTLRAKSADKIREMNPASSAASVTPADSDMDAVTCGVFVGTGGNLSVIFARDSAAVTLNNVVGGTVYPFRLKQIRDTGTTASNIVALFP